MSDQPGHLGEAVATSVIDCVFNTGVEGAQACGVLTFNVAATAATAGAGRALRAVAGLGDDIARSAGQVDDAVGVADGVPSSPDFVVHPNGEVVPVPTAAVGPTPVRTGTGVQFTGGSGGHGLNPRVTDVRIMAPVTTGKYTYPNGYVSYGNAAAQTVNPWTGHPISRSNAWWHWPWTP